jgi:tripartite-type tricarboxylate transporter receptor subunit TctC
MRKPGRYVFRLFAGVIISTSLFISCSLGQEYPSKPIRIIIGFTPGTAIDFVARLVAQKLSEQLGQSAIVENRIGASGSIANERVATSPPDGYTLLLLSSSGTILPALRAKLPYDLERDFAPVSLVGFGTGVLVLHPSVPARSVKELIALSRSRPGKLNYGSSGVGTSPHLAGELFNLMANVRIVHVPYKGATEFVIANAAGEVDMSFASITPALPFLEAEKLRALAVTSAKRVSFIPSIPTLHESGLPGYDRSSWYGVLAPARVPKEIITQLNAAIGKAFNTPEVKTALNKQALEPQTSTPEQYGAFVRDEIAQNARLIKLSGVKAE